jgi:plasmid stability protein
MARLTIRKLDDAITSRLRVRAVRHRRSLEDEAREILAAALTSEPATALNFAESIRRHMQPVGGVDHKLLSREPMRQLPKFTN